MATRQPPPRPREPTAVSRSAAVQVTGSDRLTAAERTQVEAVDRAATLVDGVAALDDQARLDLQYDATAAVRHLVVRHPGDDTVVGYAALRPGSATGLAVGQLVVDPRHRDNGLGTQLLHSLITDAGSRDLRVWAHGDHRAARGLADRLSFLRMRELRQLRAILTDPVPAPTPAPGVTLRTFHVGEDEGAWLAVNAAAFRDHPEQGALTATDLAQRMAQPWFDPDGFFLAERDGQLVGFHWTKVHPPSTTDRDPIGEVYGLGVHPDAQGLGLGKTLTMAGLHSLQRRGLREVMLYVESDNAAALALYQRLGFAHVSSDVMYQRRSQPDSFT